MAPGHNSYRIGPMLIDPRERRLSKRRPPPGVNLLIGIAVVIVVMCLVCIGAIAVHLIVSGHINLAVHTPVVGEGSSRRLLGVAREAKNV